MALDKEELGDFNQMISVFVLFYKTIWSEVEKQFSELSTEEKHKIFGVIAPSIVQMLNMISDDYDAEETQNQKKEEKNDEETFLTDLIPYISTPIRLKLALPVYPCSFCK